MRNSWILLLVLVGAVAAVLIGVMRGRAAQKKKRGKRKYKAIANTAAVRELPEYKKAMKKYRMMRVLVVGLFGVSLVSLAVVAARPISTETDNPQYSNRDIMLCLDVSGSMSTYVQQLLEYFEKITEEFKGQRVGLTIFDGVPATLAPLSDDYDALIDLFKDLREDISSYSYAIMTSSSGMSQIGPGLAGCVNAFDKLGEEERSRAIILATDNYAADQAFSLAQAANYAKRYNVAIYGISTSDWRSQAEIENADTSGRYEAEESREFRQATLATGGAYYGFSEYTSDKQLSIDEIVDQIMKLEAARYEGVETMVEKDAPLVFMIIMAICLVACLILGWRIEL